MQRSKAILWLSVLLCMLGVITVMVVAVLGKDGNLDGGRLTKGKVEVDIALLGLSCVPFFALAALCVWWRENRGLAVVGLIAVSLGVGVAVWGTVSDYLSWSRRPPPTDQITYVAGFVGMLGSWVACVVYLIIGLAVRTRKPKLSTS